MAMKNKFIFFLTAFLLLSSCQVDFDNHLKRETESYTHKHCPMRIEEGNTLDSMTYDINTRTLTRWHTLSGIMDSPASREAFANHPDLIRNQLLMELRGDVEKQTCKDEGIFFRYVFRSSATGQNIFTTTFSLSDYIR